MTVWRPQVETEMRPKLDDAMDIVEARDMEEDDFLKDPQVALIKFDGCGSCGSEIT